MSLRVVIWIIFRVDFICYSLEEGKGGGMRGKQEEGEVIEGGGKGKQEEKEERDEGGKRERGREGGD